MGCCGQKRMPLKRPQTASAASRRPASSPALQAAASTPRPSISAVASISLRYLRQGGIILRGPVTGRQYSFTAARPIQPVDAQDAAALLRTSWFKRS
jgi:hypothetical protein